MSNNTSGLNYLSNTNQAETTEDSETSPQYLGKGSMNVAGAGKVAMPVTGNKQMLQNLQAEIDKRQGGFLSPFLEGIKDAVAITSHDPGAAMAARDKEKRAQQESIFGMRQQIEAIKAAQEYRNTQSKSLLAAVGGGGGDQGSNQMTVGNQAQPQAGGSSGLVNGIFPEDAAEVRRLLQTNPDAAEAYYQKALGRIDQARATGMFSPESEKQQSYFLNGKTVQLTPNQYKALPPQVKDKIDRETWAKLGYVPSTATPTGAPSAVPVAKPTDKTAATTPAPSAAPVSSSFNPKSITPSGVITSGIGTRLDPLGSGKTIYHNGVDVGGKLNDPVNAVVGGTVVSVEQDKNPGKKIGYGNRVFVQDDNGQIHSYSHLNSIGVKPGDTVKPGQPVGALGSTGASTAPHVHYMVEKASPAAATAPAPTAAAAEAPPKFDNPKEEEAYYKGKTTAAEEEAKSDRIKDDEYKKTLTFAPDAFKNYTSLLEKSKGKQDVFNLEGKHPIAGMFAQDWVKGEHATPTNDKLRNWLLDKDKQGFYDEINKNSSQAQADWAKNLVSGAGGRLTNADLKLGEKAKGVGTGLTYEAHLANMAENMEETRTAYNRADGWFKFKKANPSAKHTDYETSPYYLHGARDAARQEVASYFKDLPEAKYVQKDKKTGKRFIRSSDGKSGIFIE